MRIASGLIRLEFSPLVTISARKRKDLTGPDLRLDSDLVWPLLLPAAASSTLATGSDGAIQQCLSAAHYCCFTLLANASPLC